MTVILQAPGVRAEIDPTRGARLVSLRFDDLEVLGRADDSEVDDSIGEGCYPMVPWAGRIRDGRLDHDGVTHALPRSPDGHALHGTGRDAVWSDHGAGQFSVQLGEPWPEAGEATLHYQVRPHGLRTTLTWSGRSVGCSLGFHPWFRRRLSRGGPLQLDASPTVMVERGADGLPTGRLVDPAPPPWDDCFELAGPPVLDWPGALRLTLTSDARHWVVYDRPASVLCVEPQTVPPDVFAHPELRVAGPWQTSVTFDLDARGASHRSVDPSWRSMSSRAAMAGLQE